MPTPVNLSRQHTRPCAHDLIFETDFWPHSAFVRVLRYLNSTAHDSGQTMPRLFYLQRDSNQNPLDRKLGGPQVLLQLLVCFIFVENELIKCRFFFCNCSTAPSGTRTSTLSRLHDHGHTTLGRTPTEK